jgi:adenylate cyclase
MKYAWEAAIAAQEDKEVIWSIGQVTQLYLIDNLVLSYRGLDDYAAHCPGCSDQEKAMHINWVMSNMTQC